MTLHAVLVVYNMNIDDSPSYQSCVAALGGGLDTLWVVDNSPAERFRQKNLRQGVSYIDMGGNQGIPRAYNCAIERIPHHADTAVVFFDQDTTIPNSFFARIKIELDRHPTANIFLPIVRDKRGLLSPCRVGRCRARRLHDMPHTVTHNVSAINSGMTVRASLFRHIRFDSKIFLDYADHDFIRQCKALPQPIGYRIVDCELFQRFSGSERPSVEEATVRFRIFLRDYSVYCRKWVGRNPECLMFAIARAFKLSIRYQDAAFIAMLLSQSKNRKEGI